MLNQSCTRAAIAGLGVVAVITLGCGGDSPSAPSQPPGPNALSVSAIQPNTGSTSGASLVRITGAGFQSGAKVTVDGTVVDATLLTQWTLSVSMPPHTSGMVDVVVTNPAGQGLKVPGGFTYVLIPLVVTEVFPNVGSTGGGTSVKITGTGFHVGTTVKIDGMVRPAYFPSGSGGTSMTFTAQAHTSGTVDIVVTNPDGQTLTKGYTYASPDSFDFNGDWEGWAYKDPDFDGGVVILFTVRNNVLVSLSCGSALDFTSSPPLVSNGEFAFAGDGGSVSGRILSANQASGTIDAGTCLGYLWSASKR